MYRYVHVCMYVVCTYTLQYVYSQRRSTCTMRMYLFMHRSTQYQHTLSNSTATNGSMVVLVVFVFHKYMGKCSVGVDVRNGTTPLLTTVAVAAVVANIVMGCVVRFR